MLQFWRSHLLEFEFQINHRDGINSQALEVLSRLETRAQDFIDLEHDLPVAVIDLSEDKNKAVKAHYVQHVTNVTATSKNP